MVKHLLERTLGALTRAIIAKYRPRVVAITGSVGKTTTKSAIAVILATQYRVGYSEKNYNNELGLPLTVLQCEAPGRSPLQWLGLYIRAFWLLLSNDALFPQVLVLEMGADHPGDIAYLMSIAPPDISVVTAVSAVHTEFFGTVEGVLTEKKQLLTRIGADKIAIFNADDKHLPSIRDEIQARVYTYALHEDANTTARDIKIHYAESGVPSGVEAEINMAGDDVTVNIPGVIGRPIIYSVLAGVQVALAMNVSVSNIQKGVSTLKTPAGRMRIVAGIKNTTLIDDTYNSSPRAAEEALHALAAVSGARRRIAVLGDMLEQGAHTQRVHADVGTLVANLHVDVLITVGAASRATADAARAGGMSEEHIFSFDLSPEAGAFLQDRLQPGDVILVKGSQGSRMEKIIKEVMAEPLQAEKLLVRQSKHWLK